MRSPDKASKINIMIETPVRASQMNKKVVVQILRAPIGGIRKHVYDILENTSADAYRYIFITNMDDADSPLPQLRNLELFNLNIQEKPSLRDLLNMIRIYFHLYGANVDVVHGHGAKGGLYARIVSYLLRAKCIYTPHGGSLHRVHGKVKNMLYDAVEIFLVPFTDIFLFESNYSQNVFFQNIANVSPRSMVNYNGIELPSSRARHQYRAGEKLKLASFGLLRNLKGHDIAIEALALLRKHEIPFSYSIYGMGEELNNLQQLIARHMLQDSITIHEYTNDVSGEMLKYDLILHPSRFESFGYVPVEAMALKIPVIASQEGGLKEVIGPTTGFVSLGNTPQEYYRILVDLYTGKVSVQDKIDAGYQKVVESFTREKMLKKISKIYDT